MQTLYRALARPESGKTKRVSPFGTYNSTPVLRPLSELIARHQVEAPFETYSSIVVCRTLKLTSSSTVVCWAVKMTFSSARVCWALMRFSAPQTLQPRKSGFEPHGWQIAAAANICRQSENAAKNLENNCIAITTQENSACLSVDKLLLITWYIIWKSMKMKMP